MLPTLYAKLIGLALIIALVVGGWLYVVNLKSQIAEGKAQEAALSSQISVLADKLVQQNAAVDALAKAGDVRLAAAQKDLAAAKTSAAVHTAKANSTYAASAAFPGTTCEADRQSSLSLMNGAAK